MDEKGILIMLGSTFGTVYRSIFTTDLDSVKKFIISLVLSAIMGFSIILYIREHETKSYVIVIISLLVGLLSHNAAQIVLKIGTKSEDIIVDNASDYIDKKSKKLLSKIDDIQDALDISKEEDVKVNKQVGEIQATIENNIIVDRKTSDKAKDQREQLRKSVDKLNSNKHG